MFSRAECLSHLLLEFGEFGYIRNVSHPYLQREKEMLVLPTSAVSERIISLDFLLVSACCIDRSLPFS